MSPFIRYTRDRRGYESTVVMHAYRGKTRVLYLFRSPSGVKIGRHPLDAEVQEALEHTHPDLSFDWDQLLREPPAGRVEPVRAFRSHRPEPPRARPAADSVPPIVEDESVLGRALGAREAARLRRVYAELMQRIARRARTPEDRDRLTERLTRLNPDDWADEAAVRAAAGSVEADWEAIAGELPHRRRGRRAGRAREDGRGRLAVEAGGPEASGIIRGEDEPHGMAIEELDAGPVDQNRDLSDAGDGDRLSADAEAAATGPVAPDTETDDPDVPWGN